MRDGRGAARERATRDPIGSVSTFYLVNVQMQTRHATGDGFQARKEMFSRK